MKKVKVLKLLLLFLVFIVSCREDEEQSTQLEKEPDIEVDEGVTFEFVKEYIEEEKGTPVSGGELRISLVDEPRHLNSAIQSGAATGVVSSQIFASLLRIDRQWNFHPNLAKSWEVSEDGLQITFTLQDEAYFHDMEEITVEDVAFSFDIVKSNHPFISMLAAVSKVEEVSKKEGIIHLSQPSPVLLTAMASPMLPILPKHVYGDGQDIVGHPANMKPVGSGPFMFVEWKPKNEIILDKFDKYFIPSLPYLDRITFSFIPDKSKSLALENKSVDLIGFMEEKGVLSYASKDKLEHLYKDSNGYGAIGPILWLAFNLKRTPFDDVRVRQAIAYTIDRDLIVKTLFGTADHVATGPISPGTPFYSKDYNLYDVNIEKANKLLDEAGYKRDENGIRFSIILDPVTQYYSKRIAVFIKDTLLRNAGIDVNIVEHDTLKQWAERVANHDFDMAVDLVYNWSDPVIGVHRTYSSKNIRKGVLWSNTQSYSNPKVDELFDKAEVENSFEKRKELYYEFQRILADELPLYPICVIPYVTIYDKKIGNMNNSIWGLLFPFDRIYWKKE